MLLYTLLSCSNCKSCGYVTLYTLTYVCTSAVVMLRGHCDLRCSNAAVTLCFSLDQTFHREYLTLPSSRHLEHRLAADQSQQLLRISLGPSARKENPNMRTFMVRQS